MINVPPFCRLSAYNPPTNGRPRSHRLTVKLGSCYLSTDLHRVVRRSGLVSRGPSIRIRTGAVSVFTKRVTRTPTRPATEPEPRETMMALSRAASWTFVIRPSPFNNRDDSDLPYTLKAFRKIMFRCKINIAFMNRDSLTIHRSKLI